MYPADCLVGSVDDASSEPLSSDASTIPDVLQLSGTPLSKVFLQYLICQKIFQLI